MPEDTLTIQTQNTLIQFLRAEIEIGFTLLQTAALDTGDDPQDASRAEGKAVAALGTVRHLSLHVKDPGVRAEIEARAGDLETAIQLRRQAAASKDKILQGSN